MSQRQLEQYTIFIGKMLWYSLKWLVTIIFTASVWLWEEWAYFINHWDERTGWVVRSLIILLLAMVTLGWFFVYNNWQVIASEGLKTAVCVRYPWACLRKEIRQEARKDVLQGISSGSLINTGLTR